MTDQAIVKHENTIMEQVLITGDLAKLTPEQRMSYYMETCKSLGLNPLSRPFDYITLNGRLTLYARKDAADQLRKLNGVSIDDVNIRESDTQFIVTVKGHDRDGRADVEIGVVNKGDMRGDTANAMMKAVTKGKRRFTLSICGLGMLDETEVETIPNARPVIVKDNGEIEGEYRDPEPPKVTVKPHTPPSLEDALNMRTPKGKQLGELTDEQLQYLIDHAANGLQAAAVVVLNSRVPPPPEEPQQ
jgi:hypothetical protein